MERKNSNAVRSKRPGLYLKPKTIMPIVETKPIKKNINKKQKTEVKGVDAKIKLDGTQLVIEKDNKKVMLFISKQQIEMLKVAFTEIV